jgi:hypothetical protein
VSFDTDDVDADVVDADVVDADVVDADVVFCVWRSTAEDWGARVRGVGGGTEEEEVEREVVEEEEEEEVSIGVIDGKYYSPSKPVRRTGGGRYRFAEGKFPNSNPSVLSWIYGVSIADVDKVFAIAKWE